MADKTSTKESTNKKTEDVSDDAPKDRPRENRDYKTQRVRGRGNFRGRGRGYRYEPYPKRDSFVNQPIAVGGYGEPIKSYIQITVEFDELPIISDILFRAIRAYDSRFVPSTITNEQFAYIHNLLVFYRRYDVATKCGNYVGYELPQLPSIMDSLKNKRFPKVIAEYVETIGEVTLDGLRVLPYIDNMREYFRGPDNMFFVWDNVNRRFTDEPCNIENFHLQYSLVEYEMNMSRVQDYTNLFRPINWDNTNGTNELLVSTYQDEVTGTTNATAPTNFLLEVFVKGAMYKFWNTYVPRDHGDVHQFPHRYKHTGIVANVTLGGIIARSMNKRN